MTKDEALKLALEALLWANEEINGWMDDAQGLDPVDHPEIMSAITAIKEALAQSEQEPVGWAEHGVINWLADKQFNHTSFLYDTPAQRTWVGLTDDEYAKLAEEFGLFPINQIEAKLKEKNR